MGTSTPDKPVAVPKDAPAVYHSLWLTVPLGIFAGGLLAALVGFVLTLLCLIFPRWTGFNSEFDILLLIGMPIIVIPGGAIAGGVGACVPRSRIAYLLGLICASPPALLYFALNAFRDEAATNDRNQFVQSLVTSLCMVSAAAIGLWLTLALLWLIERFRSRAPMAAEP